MLDVPIVAPLAHTYEDLCMLINLLPLRLLCCVALVCVFAACERHPPLNESQAEALANATVGRTGADWGRAESLKLSDWVDDRRFWVVRYRPSEDGSARMVAVNYRSGWVRILSPDDALTAVAYESQKAPVVLLLEEISRDEWTDDLLQQWQGRSQELNSAAREAGREPLYSLRQSAHSWQLIWGWNDGRGSDPGPKNAASCMAYTPPRNGSASRSNVHQSNSAAPWRMVFGAGACGTALVFCRTLPCLCGGGGDRRLRQLYGSG